MDVSRVYHRLPDLVCRKSGSETIIVPLRNKVADMNSLYTLNDTAAFIWEQIDGRQTVSQIIHLVMKEYDIDEPSASQDVIEVLRKMEGKVTGVVHS